MVDEPNCGYRSIPLSPPSSISHKLALQVLASLSSRGETLATAESLTGGLILSTLTDIPGASSSVHGGIIAYSNSVKQALLGVPSEILWTDGPVSAACAKLMAENVRQRLGTDWGIATTGYAGRNNVQEQAVEDGLFYVHVAGKNCSRGSKFQTEGLNRQANRWEAVDEGLKLLLSVLKE